jgi:hypothetical protein
MEDDFHPNSWTGKVKRLRLDGRKHDGMFSARLATNGPQRGDHSHGARALLQINNRDLAGYLVGKVEGEGGHDEQVITLVASGDMELQALADILRWAGIQLNRAIKEMGHG